MDLGFMFFINSILLGIGLAMDAFSVSLANALNEPDMKMKKTIFIAGVFAFFQALMPLIGWVCVHTILNHFKRFQSLIPFIALFLLCFIGGKMLLDGFKKGQPDEEPMKLGIVSLLVQGIATSIDALSVGFTIANYNFLSALLCALIIATVTFIICMTGLFLGKKFSTHLASKSQVLGGVILIFIGFEIFITGIF